MPSSTLVASSRPSPIPDLPPAAIALGLAGRGVPLGTWALDLDSGLVRWDEGCHALHRIPVSMPPSLAGMLALYTPASRAGIESALAGARSAGAAIDVEVELGQCGVSEGWLRLIGECSAPGRLHGIAIDLTESKRAAASLTAATEAMQSLNEQFEQTICRAQQLASEAAAADEAKSVFLATMSHEIRTPLNGIIGMTSLIEETPLSEEQRDCLRTIKLSGEALLAVINDTLDFSKIEAGQLEIEQVPFDPSACTYEAAELLAAKAHDRHLELACVVAPDLPARVMGDPNRLRQILVNLIGNAVKFTARGEVVVSLRHRPVPDNPEAVMLEFSVRDTGIGIPRERQDRLFRSFSQVDSTVSRHYGGTGLGLAISKRLALLMGGDMAVESDEGKGATFRFTVLAPLVAGATRTTPSWPQFPGTSILILTNQPTNRGLLAAAVRDLGGEPLFASTAAEALALMDDGTFGAAIVDHRPPDLDALEACAVLNQSSRRTFPILALGPFGHKLRGPGIDAAILKPLHPEVIRDHLARVIAGARPEPRFTPGGTPAPRGTETALPRLRVLLVEDNPVNQKVGRMMLSRLGLEATVAGHGGEAVTLLEHTEFDVVLMDLQMPVMDGLTATEVIRTRRLGGDPWIVALTAGGLQSGRDRTRQAGMNDHLYKPLKLEQLAEALQRVPVRTSR